jgi:hypothetical protein
MPRPFCFWVFRMQMMGYKQSYGVVLDWIQVWIPVWIPVCVPYYKQDMRDRVQWHSEKGFLVGKVASWDMPALEVEDPFYDRLAS